MKKYLFLLVTCVICLCGSAYGQGERENAAADRQDARQMEVASRSAEPAITQSQKREVAQNAYERAVQTRSKEDVEALVQADKAAYPDRMPDVDRSRLAGSKEVDRSTEIFDRKP